MGAVCLWGRPAPAQPAAAPDADTVVNVQADRQSGVAGRRIDAQGHVRIEVHRPGLPPDTLRADSARISLGTPRSAEATGHVRLDTSLPSRASRRRHRRPARRPPPPPTPITLTGDTAQYDFDTGSGSVSKALIDVQGLLFNADRIDVTRGHITLTRGRMTACDAIHPDYWVQFRSAQITPGKDALVKRVQFYLLGHQILGLPSHRFRLGASRGTDTVPLPTLGQSGAAGAYVSWRPGFNLAPGTTTQSEVQLTSRLGPRVFSLTRAGGYPTPFGRVNWHEERVVRRPGRAIVDRAPEVGWLLDPTSTAPAAGWLRGELALGFVRERLVDASHRPDVSDTRLRLALSTVRLPFGRSNQWEFSAAPGLEIARYLKAGTTYHDAYLDVAAERRWNAQDRLRLELIKHFPGGHTPFRFDEAFLPTELHQDLVVHPGRWYFRLETAWDVQRGSLFDVKVVIGRQFHCLEPHLVWRRRLNEIGFEIALVGLGKASATHGAARTDVFPPDEGQGALP